MRNVAEVILFNFSDVRVAIRMVQNLGDFKNTLEGLKSRTSQKLRDKPKSKPNFQKATFPQPMRQRKLPFKSHGKTQYIVYKNIKVTGL